jgi:hypothetical protein
MQVLKTKIDRRMRLASPSQTGLICEFAHMTNFIQALCRDHQGDQNSYFVCQNWTWDVKVMICHTGLTG